MAPHVVKPAVKFGGGNILVWGFMTWKGVGNISRIEGIMDCVAYQKILVEKYLKTLENSGMDIAKTILQ